MQAGESADADAGQQTPLPPLTRVVELQQLAPKKAPGCLRALAAHKHHMNKPNQRPQYKDSMGTDHIAYPLMWRGYSCVIELVMKCLQLQAEMTCGNESAAYPAHTQQKTEHTYHLIVATSCLRRSTLRVRTLFGRMAHGP